jgi:hypothetical protein
VSLSLHPKPFVIESGGALYDVVERGNLPSLTNTELFRVVGQAMVWVVDALKVDGRSDPRKGVDEQNLAAFLCQGSEYQAIKLAAWEEWFEAHDHDWETWGEFEAQFQIDEVDDSVRQPALPHWAFFVFDHGSEWVAEGVLEAAQFRGVFYVWNVRTQTSGDPWIVDPSPMLCAPTDDHEWWVTLFADLLHAFLAYSLPLSDDRELWLDAWRFPTKRLWLALRSGAESGYVDELKQRLVAYGLEAPTPVYVVEERFEREAPGGGMMLATRRLRLWGGDPLE